MKTLLDRLLAARSDRSYSESDAVKDIADCQREYLEMDESRLSFEDFASAYLNLDD